MIGNEYARLRKAESAEFALRESNRRMHSHRVELYQANQVCENSKREQVWSHVELESGERALQETRSGTLQENARIEKDFLY